MPDDSLKSSPFVHRARLLSHAAGISVTLVGALVLVGWLFDVSDFKSVYAQITMKANTAVCLALAGIGLFFLLDENKAWRRLSDVCALAIASIGLLTLSQHIFGWNLHIDQLLFTEPSGALATTSPGRMGITASLDFMMFGLAIVLLNRGKAVSLAQVLTILAGLWALLAIIGYAYQAEQLFAIARYTGIALHTALALFVLSLGILARSIDRGFISVIGDDDTAGIMTRRLLVIAVVVPFVLGWIRLAGQRAGYFDLGLGAALLVIAIIVIFLLSIWRAARHLKHVEEKRLIAEGIAKEGQAHRAEQARLLDLSNDAIIVRDHQDRISYWSAGAERLYGYKRHEALGRVTHELLRTEHSEPLEVIFEKLRRAGRWEGELVHTRLACSRLSETCYQMG